LVELALVEQRYKAVREVLDDGASVTDVARRYGVARQTVHGWLKKYASGGMGALADRSSRPATCPHQVDANVEARIVAMRRAHPAWGPRTIRSRLALEGVDPVPGRSSIYRALIRANLIEPTRQRRRRDDYKRWERSRSMELWQMDVMGRVKLRDGTEASVVTGIDDHSRYCVVIKVVKRATAGPVCDALVEALGRYGLPETILTDNGKVFTGRFGVTKSEVRFDRICRENGIQHLLTAPYSPTTTGKVERMHKTMRSELLNSRVFDSLDHAQQELDAWAQRYNHDRPHQGIGDVSPIERFKLARQEEAVEVVESAFEPEVRKSINEFTRRVNAKGSVTIARTDYHAGKWLTGEVVVITTAKGLVSLHHNDVLIATHVQRHETHAPRSIPKKAKPAKPATTGNPVQRKADGYGAISFAGTTYHVGLAHKRQWVQVAIVGDKVQCSVHGHVVRMHAIKHDRNKEYGAFAFPKGKARRDKPA
jgi:transposase InsO family protein